MSTTPRNLLIAALAGSSLLLTSCSTAESGGESNAGSEPGATPAVTHGHEHDAQGSAEAIEVASPQARIVATYDGGIYTLDANTLELLEDTPLDGFNRINSAGDGRHVFVSTGGGFQLFDAGAWTEPHGDHTHSYTSTPELTEITYATEKPGHVVNHAGKTILFGDGDGKIQILDTTELLKGTDGSDGTQPTPEVKSALEAHHGVAVALDNGDLLHTLGNEDSRNGAVVFNASGTEVARSEECPGVHGEAAAQGGAIALGCEDGVLIYTDGEFTKAQAPDTYGRIGNQAGSEASPVILGDYKVDRDADLERPERISLTNTQTGELKFVDLGTSYTFRSLGRGPEGEAVVLGTDGQLHIIDPESAEVTDTYPVIGEWTEPEVWQEARPTLFIHKDRAYVSDPTNKELHVVDLSNGNILASTELPEATNELTGVTG